MYQLIATTLLCCVSVTDADMFTLFVPLTDACDHYD